MLTTASKAARNDFVFMFFLYNSCFCFLFLETKVGLLGFYLLKHLGFLRIREGGRLLGRLAVVGVAGLQGLLSVETHGQVVGDALYLQLGRGGGMGAGELHFCLNLNLAGLTGRSGDSLIYCYSLNNPVTDARYSGQLPESSSLIA